MNKQYLQEAADNHRVQNAILYAQALEDGYEFPGEIVLPVGTLVPGRLFQLSKPDVDGNHVRELGWYRFESAVKQPPSRVGTKYGYWGTIGTYIICAYGPYNKNGSPKGHCRQIDLSVGEGASGRCETRIWKIAKGRETANSKGVKFVKVAENGRAEKYADFEEWATSHEGEQFSTQELSEKSGFSSQTMLKYLKTSAHFTKIKSGLYECGKNQTV
jgi:hypothetical protein|tara:strand:- start:415 stop:1062 length:648 start_codon:yes stop_codon:yes gene_type:complete